jgi:transposase InsO family protein
MVREAEAYAAANRNGKKERAALLARFLGDRRAVGGDGAGGAGESDDATGLAEERDRIPTLGTLYRWMALAREADGHPATLLDARQARRADAGDAHAAIPEPARALFLSFYLTTRQMRAKECYRATASLTRSREGEAAARALPDYRAFLRLVQALPREIVVRYRNGERAWAARYRPYIERDPTKVQDPDGTIREMHVNEWWVTDHMQFDVLCRLPDGRLGRPWLTEWIDVRSRRRMGWWVATGPSQDTVLAALADAIGRGGVPAHVYMDNGREFTSMSPEGGFRKFRVRMDEARVETALAHLGVVPHFSRPRNPQARPIERWFGTTHEHFDKYFATYTGKDTQHKPDELAAALKEPAKIPTVAQLAAAYALFVQKRANQDTSEGAGLEGRSPLAVWQAGMQAPGYVHRTATEGELAFLFMKHTKPLAVRRGAVEFAGRRWTCRPLQEPGAPVEVYARYRQDEAGRLYLFTPKDELVGIAERQELLAYGAKQEHIRAADRLRRRREAVTRAWRDELTAHTAQPDDVLRAALSAQLAAAPAPPPDPRPTVIRPLRTPFRAASKALKAVVKAAKAGGRPAAEAVPREDPAVEFYRSMPPEPERDHRSDEERAQDRAQAFLEEMYAQRAGGGNP